MIANAPTNIRRRVVAVSMAMAFILYLDRICLAEIVKSASFHREVALTPQQTGRVLGIFFFSYALLQVPTGWISDRFGPRLMLTGYIAWWSICTALTGMVSSFPALLAMRFLCAAGEAGAYPSSNAVLRRWIPAATRARANSLVLVGGRIGGTVAPFLTAWMVVSLGHWRPVLWIDGAVGLAIALTYWTVVRNRPEEHPGCNPAERALIGESAPEPRPSARELGALLRAFCVNRNLVLSALMGFFVAVGSAYIITWLPTYLKEQKHVEDVSGGRLVTLVLGCGLAGQLAGGWLADRAVLKFGPKWGRIFTFGICGILAGGGYLGCLVVDAPWAVVACCCLVCFAADLGNPAIWAYLQDIGGRVAAAAFGWVNMWGNFGAAVIALLVPSIVAAGRTIESGQRHVFMVCAGALFLSAALSLGLEEAKPLLPGAEKP